MILMLQLFLVFAAATAALHFLLHATILKMPRCKSAARLDGKTVIVTGANSGIGKTTAMDLARRGARVIVACRNRRRAEAAIQEIVKGTGNNQVIFMELDLASLKSVRSFAENFLFSESRLDILINNAGQVHHGKTEDGFGMCFGVNHLGHFLLTMLLLKQLRVTGRSRIVNVSSMTIKFGTIDLAFLKKHRDTVVGTSFTKQFNKYFNSKLCNNLFTHELAKRLSGSDVTCYSLHPGHVRTDIFQGYRRLWRIIFAPLTFFCVDPVSGAQTTLHCALQEGIEHLSGHFFSHCAPVPDVVAKARDDALAKKLWQLSEHFCGLS